MVEVKVKQGAVNFRQLGLAACQHFHGSLQVRAKKAGNCWQFSKTNKYELNDDKTGAMYKASPQVPLILPYKGLSPLLIFTTFSTVYTLSLSLSLYVSLSLSHTCTRSSFHSGCNELSTLPEEAATEVFIKHTAIRKVPRTGKSHSCMKQKGWG